MQSPIQLVSALRDMLRDDFGMADNRDIAVATAVNDWYLAQFPFIASRADKPDLAHIIATVRTASFPQRFITTRAADKWTDEEIADLIEMAKPPLVFKRIQIPVVGHAAMQDAARYNYLTDCNLKIEHPTGGLIYDYAPPRDNDDYSDDALGCAIDAAMQSAAPAGKDGAA